MMVKYINFSVFSETDYNADNPKKKLYFMILLYPVIYRFFLACFRKRSGVLNEVKNPLVFPQALRSESLHWTLVRCG
jgi:hypothetical protein